MKINTINKIQEIEQGQLETMRMALCFDKETNDNYLLIKDVSDNFIIIQNFDNDSNGVCILRSSNPDNKILFCGYVDNLEINILKLRRLKE